MKLDHIYNKSCAGLPDIPDDSIDVIITSPPYNVGRRSQKNKKHNIVYDEFDDHVPQEEYEEQQVQFLDACARVIKPGGSVFYNHKERVSGGVAIPPHRWVLRSSAELVQTIIWDRGSTHNVDPIRLYPSVEYVFLLRKPGYPPRFNKKCAKWKLVWEISFSETRRIAHPAPFPVELPARCIELTGAPRASVVLDPYMGSGTTAIAAIDADMHYVGYEISKNYIQMARKRLQIPLTEQKTLRRGEARGSRSKQRDSKSPSVIRLPDLYAD